MSSLSFNPSGTGRLDTTGPRLADTGHSAAAHKEMLTRWQVIDSVTVVSLIGELDAQTAPAAHQQLADALPTSSPVLLDLTELGYVSSAGLRTMLLVYRRAQRMGIPIALVGVSTELRGILSATGFLNFFQVAESLSDGLSTLRK